jgi:hypothetical protein
LMLRLLSLKLFMLLSLEKVLGRNLENLEAGDSVVVVVVGAAALNLESLNLVRVLVDTGDKVVVSDLVLDLNLDRDLVLGSKSVVCRLYLPELSELLTRLLSFLT